MSKMFNCQRPLALLSTLLLFACGSSASSDGAPVADGDSERAGLTDSSPETIRLDAANSDTVRPTSNNSSAIGSSREPNELGRIPILEYHLVVEEDASYAVSRERFRSELDTLYALGYRPISLAEMLDRRISLPRGLSPVLFVFDDASPSQFRYVEENGQLRVDPTSALGIWLDFVQTHPDWRNRGVFCTLSGAEAGRSFFGNKEIEGQRTEWRFLKVRQLDSLGFELCNHTLWHARLDKYPDPFVQEQIARGELAIDSALPGYRVRGFALPLGMWPKTRSLAWSGSWTDAKSKKTLEYHYDAVFEVAGGPARSPYDSLFDARSLPRIPLGRGMPLLPTLKSLDGEGPRARYVSDGDTTRVSRP